MKEIFDERCTEFETKSPGVPDIELNIMKLKQNQVYYTYLNEIEDVRLSKIYYALGIPFPENYLIDYKFHKNDTVFDINYSPEKDKIELIFNCPDQPVLRKDEVIEEYTFCFKKED